MRSGNSTHPSRGFGSRGARPAEASTVEVKPVRRTPTYAELSVPGPDEVPPPSGRTIWKDADHFWLRMKWQLVMFGIIGLLYLLQGALFSRVESVVQGAEKSAGSAFRSLAAQCADPAAVKRLEQAGWTVRVSPNGGCSIIRPRN